MFEREDNTYNTLIEKSVDQWLDAMRDHQDIEVRGGVKVTKDYIKYLEDLNKNLNDKNELKDKYLKKLKQSKS